MIASAGQGWPGWRYDREEDGPRLIRHGFRIVHHQDFSPKAHSYGCYFYDRGPGGSMHLNDHVGSLGLMKMLSLIDEGPHHDEEYSGPLVRDLHEWVELMRRLFLPYYESARPYWMRASSDGFFGDRPESCIYTPDVLRELIEQYETD